MKRFGFSLIILALISTLTLCAFAQNEDDVLTAFVYDSIETDSFACLYEEDENDDTLDEIIKVISDGVRNFDETISVYDFGYPKADANKLLAIYGQKVILSNYDMYYAVSDEGTYGISVSYKNGLINYIKPNYYVTDEDEIEETIEEMDEKIDYFLSFIDDDMSELEKLMTIYNRMALYCEYDISLTKYRASDFLLDNSSVCQGYATVFSSIAKKAGFDVDLTRSSAMRHIWNIVKLDGEWYHVDVTWADTKRDVYGSVNNNYFLKSNDWMQSSSGSHYGFVPPACYSTKYDDVFWNDCNSSIIILDDKMYYVKDNALYEYDKALEESSVLYTITEKWYADTENKQYWDDTFSGLAYRKGRLYFNTASKILSCKTDASDLRVEYILENSEENSIYGCFLEDGKLKIGYGKKTHFSDYDEEFLPDDYVLANYLTKDSMNFSDYITGDITCNDELDMSDAIYLLQYIMFPDLYPIEYTADIDYTNDGNLYIDDAILLLQHIMFPELYPLF